MTEVEFHAMMKAQRESFAACSREADAEGASPFGRHRWVRLMGLSTTELNGRLAEVIATPNKEGRTGVLLSGTPKGKKLIKQANLEAIPDANTSQVCRLKSQGESSFPGGLIQNTRWPTEVLEAMTYEVSPVSMLLGFPLRISRCRPRNALKDRAHFDNQWVTYMMIDPTR